MHHLVALSGGKDSTALAIALKEQNPHIAYTFFCTPTGDELPDMVQHWLRLEALLNTDILYLRDPEYPTLYSLIKHFKALPNFRQRWCTRLLKIEPAQEFYNKMSPATIYVGLRADEAHREGARIYDENIEQRFPFQEWGWNKSDVLEYLKKKSISIPERTDCAMCFFQRIGEWWKLWKTHPAIFKRISELEDKYGHTLMTPGKHKIWPHKLSDLAIEFRKGRLPREIKYGKTIDRDVGCRICRL